ncbi:MAG: glycosyltransferase [Calditrichaeota bacterium]|nr:MAG: glycosyltransferase [Calditrichota bacterium]MBL1204053.1 glycosyltransferase [Calditrichota bacterium]NOG43884.1 glycosyltransferase [Calditrichota bacterium]
MNYNPVSISVCMIVRNEEKNIRKSLNTIKDFVDEIIIVDTGSTDRTVEIANEFGAKVFHFVWNDDFASARNFALKQAACDWVLNLDADHTFICDKENSLKKPLENIKMLGLMINERTYDSDKSFQDSDRLLLFKNHCGFKYSGAIYEHPLKSIKEYAQKNKIAQPFGRIDNCRLDHHEKSNIKQTTKHKAVLKKAVKKDPDNYNYRFNFLLAQKDGGDNDSYKDELLKTVYRIEQNNPLLNESIVAIWGLFGDWVIEDNNSDSVEKFYKNAGTLTEKTKWNDIRLVWPYVKVSIMQGDFEKAISDLEKCILNGVAPDNVYLKDEEYIAPIYQLFKLINNQKPAEDFITCINNISELTGKTKTDSLQVFKFIRKHDPSLFEEIFNILNDDQKNLLSTENESEEYNSSAKIDNSNQNLISLCMIVKNEQKNLERCLKSVKGIVDEIIVVDTGSTDESVEIARKFGAKIIFTAWHNDFSEARNLALEQASSKWILHLDADEELHKESTPSLKNLLNKSHADAINVVVRNHQPAEDMVSFLDETQVRIFLNKKQYRYRNKVHEQIIPSIAENAGKFEESGIIINHFGYQTNNEQRAQRNLNLLENELQESPKDAYLLFKMGETYKAMKQWDKAAEYLTKAISNPQGNITNEIKEVIYLRLGQISLAKDDHKSAQEYASACLRFNAQNAMAKYILAITMMYSGKMEKGIKLFMELKATQNIHGLDLSEIDRLLEIFENVNVPDKILN